MAQRYTARWCEEATTTVGSNAMSRPIIQNFLTRGLEQGRARCATAERSRHCDWRLYGLAHVARVDPAVLRIFNELSNRIAKFSDMAHCCVLHGKLLRVVGCRGGYGIGQTLHLPIILSFRSTASKFPPVSVTAASLVIARNCSET